MRPYDMEFSLQPTFLKSNNQMVVFTYTPQGVFANVWKSEPTLYYRLGGTCEESN